VIEIVHHFIPEIQGTGLDNAAYTRGDRFGCKKSLETLMEAKVETVGLNRKKGFESIPKLTGISAKDAAPALDLLERQR
jgi:hypothetical protein